MPKGFVSLVILLGCMLLCSCAPTRGIYRGATAPAETILRLDGEREVQDRWEDLYVKAEVMAACRSGIMQLSGDLALGDSARLNYNRVDDLVLKVFLLNSQDKVVEYAEVGRILSGSIEQSRSFSVSLNCGEDVTAISFGYEGTLIDEEGASHMIWKLPTRSAE